MSLDHPGDERRETDEVIRVMERFENLRRDVVWINVLLLPGVDDGFDGVRNDDDRNLSSGLVQEVVEVILCKEGVCRIACIPVESQSVSKSLWERVRSNSVSSDNIRNHSVDESEKAEGELENVHSIEDGVLVAVVENLG